MIGIVSRRVISAFFLCSLFLVSLSITAQAAASFPWLDSQNSISNIIQQPDGQIVTCEFAEVVKMVDSSKAYPSYFVLQDGYQPSSRIIIMAPPLSSLRYSDALEVSGVLGTLGNGER